MKQFLKTTAIAATVATLAAPAFAAAHLSTDMTCAEYNELSGADRDKVAMMAILALNDDVVPTDGTATATASSVGTAAEESTEDDNITESAQASSTQGAGDDLSRYAEEIRILNRTCSRNWDAMVREAAAGQSGTR